MRLDRLDLDHFRSYTQKSYHFGDLTVLLGPNAAGKTNVLEAIYLISTGASFRAGVTEEMIHFGADIAHVTGIVDNSGDITSLGVVLTPGVYLGKRIAKKRFLVDGAPRTRTTFMGRLPAVIFRPEDLRLIEGSPSRRRAFLDDVLIQSSQAYSRALTAYEGALRRRNKILDLLREGTARREQLAFWDATLIKNGNIVTDHRRDLLYYLSDRTATFGRYRLAYDASTISEARLKQYEAEEVAAGYTLVGPHKDDFVIFDVAGPRERDLMKYGSRGEQRLAVLFMKLGTMSYMEEKLHTRPLLLLDDIFSELDEVHRHEVLRMTEGRQTILTTAEDDVVRLLEGAEIVRVS